MSRVAKKPVALPKGVELKVDHSTLSIKGPKGTLSMDVHPQIGIEQTEEGVQIKVNSGDRKLVAMAGTTRALLANMVTGVSEGFERKLELELRSTLGGDGFRNRLLKLLGLRGLGVQAGVELGL